MSKLILIKTLTVCAFLLSQFASPHLLAESDKETIQEWHDDWRFNVKTIILPNTLICWEEEAFRSIANRLLEGDRTIVARAIHWNHCIVFKGPYQGKVIGQSKDNKVFHVEYLNRIDGYLRKGYIGSGQILPHYEYKKNQF